MLEHFRFGGAAVPIQNLILARVDLVSDNLALERRTDRRANKAFKSRFTPQRGGTSQM